MKCTKCGAATSVLETRALAPDKTKRFRACTSCGHRFETAEVPLDVAAVALGIEPRTRASSAPAEVRRRRDAALAMPYVDAGVLAKQLGCSASIVQQIRAKATSR